MATSAMPGIEHHHHQIKPLLASDLWSAAKSTRAQREKTRTGCNAVDEALRGSVEGGQAGFVAITGDKGSGRTALAFALMSSHLLSSPTALATLIDTAGTFDVGRLYATILSHVRQRRRLARAQLRNQTATPLAPHQQQRQRQVDADAIGKGGEEEEAARVLDRVKYARVFDFVGMVDAVTEMRERLEAPTQRREGGERAEEPSVAEVDMQMARKKAERTGLKRIRSDVTHIDDTDDELDSEDDADAMVLDASEEETRPEPRMHREEAPMVSDGTTGEGMIVVDCISHIVSPMMKTNHVQTSALLSSFLRSLKHLTASHNLTTILINSAITWNVARQAASAITHHTRPPIRGPAHTSPIFSSSSHIVPALSPMLAARVDLHLLLTVQPWSHGDVISLNSTAGAPSQANQRARAGKRANQVDVLEVLSDRYSDRVGRWGPFFVDAEGIIADVDGHGKREEG